MTDNKFSVNPILNSPYDYPGRHWEMDANNQPTEKINEFRRHSSLKSPIATLRTARHQETQGDLFAQTEDGVDYATNDLINSPKVDEWRKAPSEKWGVTAETARLLKWWRNKDKALRAYVWVDSRRISSFSPSVCRPVPPSPGPALFGRRAERQDEADRRVDVA